MAVCIGVIAETASGEKRIALVPEVARKLKALGARIVVQAGSGNAALIPEAAFGADVEILADVSEPETRGIERRTPR